VLAARDRDVAGADARLTTSPVCGCWMRMSAADAPEVRDERRGYGEKDKSAAQRTFNASAPANSPANSNRAARSCPF
jgi:hypothetical protein